MRTRIDRDALRNVLRRQEGTALLILLDRALDLLPEELLPQLVEGYVHPEEILRADHSPEGLLKMVRRFHAASLRGDYYEDFWVNSKNSMTKSRGTQIFISECHRLVDLCVEAADQRRCAEAREALELIFDLMRQIDECRDDIVFFADEGGSWQVGIDWRRALPAWFRCLATTATATEYANAVREVIDRFASSDRQRVLEAAREEGNPDQRVALTE
jgi:hypothetical protein